MTGSTATVVNAATGVNVRPDPSTSGTPIASLKNGDEVKVVKDAGNGCMRSRSPAPRAGRLPVI